MPFNDSVGVHYMANGQFHYVIYGSIILKRGFCQYCQVFSFILSGQYNCCGDLANGRSKTVGYQIESPTTNRHKRKERRKQPSQKRKAELLSSQHYRCIYCNRSLSSFILWKGKLLQLRVTWDHVHPYSKGGSNKDSNFVASCQVCNMLKGKIVFESLEKAKSYLKDAWTKAGYEDEREEEIHCANM